MAAMFVEKVRSEGLAHLSYVIGHKGQAAVVDPRRDCEVYVELAARHSAAITHIFETHRNEDYVIGSLDLARRTGAQIYHGAKLDFEYGNAVSEGDTFQIGQLRLAVLETPGHTFESISLVLADESFGGDPLAAFTGDALFVGDVGRTDFLPDAREAAALLYDSVFEKLLALGDGVIVFPCHGAGSVCGKGMAAREFSTMGYERANSPVLQLGREDFIEHKMSERHHVPPYFKRMEQYNLEGAPPLDVLPNLPPLSPVALAEQVEAGAVVVDVRSAEAFAAAAVPGSLAIPTGMLSAFAGWLLPYEQPLALVVERESEVEEAVRHLVRLGYDDMAGYMAGMERWETSAAGYQHLGVVKPRELADIAASGGDFTILDVRSEDEFVEKHIPGALNIYLGKLPGHLDEVPADRPVITVCSSGRRALVAAAVLKRGGFDDVRVGFGSIAACSDAGCPISTGRADA